MRNSKYKIDERFLKRFSPKTFLDKEIDDEDLLSLIEAASSSPSCFNEQPWIFVRGKKEDFVSILADANAQWAKDASQFLFVCSRPNFHRNNKINSWHSFDSGTAMGYLILQALDRDIYVHPMAGFDASKAKEMFSLHEFECHAVLALGYTQEEHSMSSRKDLNECIIDRR